MGPSDLGVVRFWTKSFGTLTKSDHQIVSCFGAEKRKLIVVEVRGLLKFILNTELLEMDWIGGATVDARDTVIFFRS